ncbi:MAG: hypothetical protein H6821_03800 [Planctomycetaceae bacterium]|nr:hypothetical protein [Planctomycetaceae bacterium]
MLTTKGWPLALSNAKSATSKLTLLDYPLLVDLPVKALVVPPRRAQGKAFSVPEDRPTKN